MRAAGLVIVGFGLACLVLPFGFAMWARHMYASVRDSPVWLDLQFITVVSAPGLLIAGLGALLAWAGRERPVSN